MPNTIWRRRLLLGSSGVSVPAPGTALDNYFAALNPTFWYEGRHITGGVDGAALDTWQDFSPTALNLAATLTARPLYIAAMLNSLPGVRGDGSNDIMTSASVAGLNLFATNAGTIYLIMKQTGLQANNCAFGWGADGGTNCVDAILSFANTLYYDFGAQGSGGRISGAQPAGWDDNYHLIELVRSGTSGIICVDGADVVTGTFSDVLDASSQTLKVFGYSTIFLNGDTPSSGLGGYSVPPCHLFICTGDIRLCTVH